MPSKKQHKVALRLKDDNTETLAIVVVGDNRPVRQENAGRDDAGKPIYLNRV